MQHSLQVRMDESLNVHETCTFSALILRLMRPHSSPKPCRCTPYTRTRKPSVSHSIKMNLDEIALTSYSCDTLTPLLCAHISHARYGRMSRAVLREKSRGDLFLVPSNEQHPRWCTSAVDKVRERHLIWFEKRVSATGARTRASLARGTVYVRYREAFTKSRKNVTTTDFAHHTRIVRLDRNRGACSDECSIHASLTKSRDRCSNVRYMRHRCLRSR